MNIDCTKKKKEEHEDIIVNKHKIIYNIWVLKNPLPESVFQPFHNQIICECLYMYGGH